MLTSLATLINKVMLSTKLLDKVIQLNEKLPNFNFYMIKFYIWRNIAKWSNNYYYL